MSERCNSFDRVEQCRYVADAFYCPKCPDLATAFSQEWRSITSARHPTLQPVRQLCIHPSPHPLGMDFQTRHPQPFSAVEASHLDVSTIVAGE